VIYGMRRVFATWSKRCGKRSLAGQRKKHWDNRWTSSRKIPRQARDLEICCGSGGAITKTDHQEKSQTGREHEVGSLSAPLLDFDLNREIQQLRSEGRWQSGHTAKTLVKYPDFRLVLVAIKAGGRLVRHRTEGRISVHNLVGHIRLHSPEQAVELPAGHMLALERDIPHDVEALVDSAFLLTIAWPSSSSVAIQDENSV
jgi:quercetin dioxygenase-like cupin family protein